jgi:hypothetical protein
LGAKTDNPKKDRLAMMINVPIQNEIVLIVDSPSERLISIVPIPMAMRLRRPITTSMGD